ncbi:MAG TPA: squalene/phytoene synthase family protein [Myxococcota bacterium]|nr:squalene/phytoene synthase family protein [Myxococcota bacterium]
MSPEPAPSPEVLRAYAHCRGVTRASHSSFAAAFWMFPKEKRRALHAIYAFCRLADDIADDPAIRGNRGLLLERWREELAGAYEGKAVHPVGIALGDAVRRFALPRRIFEDLLLGVESDLRRLPIETFDDLYTYCYRVASTVGLLIVRVLGFRNPRTLDYAEAMGVAVQLTNVLRDVGEDAASGRVYLAREDLKRFGVCEDALTLDPAPDELRLLLACYAERARIFYERAESLRPDEDRARLRPADAMGAIYRTLLDRLQAERFPQREKAVRLSNPHRLAIAASVWLRGARA